MNYNFITSLSINQDILIWLDKLIHVENVTKNVVL